MATTHKIPSSPWRAIMETAMLANSVRPTAMVELYALALNQPEVVATDEPMYRPAQFGLPKGARVLVSNDGGVVGRTGSARLLTRTFGPERSAEIQALLREAVHGFTRRACLHLEGIVGLHPDFMVKAHLLSPATDAKNMLDWGLNFCPFAEPWVKAYAGSRVFDEPDIIVFADPEWSHPEFPDGCVIIDEAANCIAVLGLRYFGERKNGTLTLAWAIGVRQNMVACHGGLKTIGARPPVAVFGLSGSGAGAITNSLDHGGRLRQKGEEVTVIHDDAFLVDLKDDYSVALEPSVFEKTAPLALGDPRVKYIYSAQNVGVTLMPDGTRKLVGADVRNANGRSLRSREMSRTAESCARPGMVIWLQKDSSLPPLCKVKGSALAVAMGASLATVEEGGTDGRLVIEPFANPFRVHSLLADAEQFWKLFKAGCACYIMNTHAFGVGDEAEEIPLDLALAMVTELVRGTIQWREWRTFHGLFVPKNGGDLFGAEFDKRYRPNRNNLYLRFLRDRLQERITFLSHKRDDEREMSNNFIAPLVSARNTIDKILEPDLYT
jgi:phosphoenolpyruvate carboxykinase (ATP)